MKFSRLSLPLSGVFLLTTTVAEAGGLYLREFGQPSQGTASAGAQVLVEDASLAFQNPSGVFKLEGESEWMVTGIVLDSSVKFDADDNNTVVGTNGGDAGDTLFGGALFYARQINEKWGATFALNSVAGNALEFDDDYVGRYTGLKTELLTVTAAPSIAYKVNDELSVAFTAGVFYGELELDQAIPPLQGPAVPERDGLAQIDDGDDTDIIFGLTALWEPADDWRFGFSYLTETELKFDGDLELNFVPGSGTSIDNLSADVEIKFPQLVSLGALHNLTDELSVMMRLAWEDWSSLSSIPISTDRVAAKIPLDYDDIYSISVGLRYRPNVRWSYYAGLGYDSDPGQAETRIAILPLDRQFRIAGGATYSIDERRELGATLTYVDLGSARTSVDTAGGLYSGKFDTNEIYIFGVNYGWR